MIKKLNNVDIKYVCGAENCNCFDWDNKNTRGFSAHYRSECWLSCCMMSDTRGKFHHALYGTLKMNCDDYNYATGQ